MLGDLYMWMLEEKFDLNYVGFKFLLFSMNIKNS